MKNQLWMYVDIYISMKKATRIVSHLIKRSLVPLNTRKYPVAYKFEHPYSNIYCWVPPQPMILAPEKTHRWSQPRDSRRGSMQYPHRIHIGEIFETNLRIFTHGNPSFCKKGNTDFPSTHSSLTEASWTKSLSLEVLKNTTLRWFWDIKKFYKHSSPGLKYVFLTLMCGSRLRSIQLECLCTREYNKQGSPLPHSPDNFANPSFCRKGNIQISHQRAPLPTASWTRWS